MTQLSKLFVVYDPTRAEQPALARAAHIAAGLSAKVHVFSCIFAETSKSTCQAVEISRLLDEQRLVLEQAVAPLLASGIEVSTEVEWDKSWSQAVVRAALKNAADVVMKSSSKQSGSKQKSKRDSEAALMRDCLSPVLLVKDGEQPDVPRVLAAIDICAKTKSYERLNDNVIEFSRRMIDRREADVHYINAFRDYKFIPSRDELIRRCGADSEKIHIMHGEPRKVIVEQARRMGASLVVVGNSARSGLPAAFMGNTVEKVVGNLQCDVLSMPALGGEECLK